MNLNGPETEAEIHDIHYPENFQKINQAGYV